MDYHVKDINLADKGVERIEWAARNMKVLKSLIDDHKDNQIFKGIKIGACLHVTTETANLMIALKECGADVYLCASNPMSTQDDVAAALVKEYDIPVFAIHGEDRDTYYSHIKSVLSQKPHITMDDGADLISTLHSTMKENIEYVKGGTEETTTGVIRLKSMAKDGVLQYPVIAVNDSYTKYLFDNRYGTGQSTVDGILRATNFLFAGSVVVVAGYGWCGRGFALRSRGMGARVIVTEVNPVRALEAVMDGFEVMPMKEAAKFADLIVTLTGDIDVVSRDVLDTIKNSCIVANSGHFDVEIDVKSLREYAQSVKKIRDVVEIYKLKNGKEVVLLAEGRLVNLSAAEGHPSMVMDMSFANQFLAAKYINENYEKMEKKVYKLPDEIDEDIAMRKLKTMGIDIDILTEKQRKYLSSWKEGT